MTLSIGVLGAGPVGKALAVKASDAGHTVQIANSRGPETISDSARQLGNNVSAVSASDAAANDVVVLAVPFVLVPEAAKHRGDWTGVVVIDATNQFASYDPYDGRADTDGLTGSEWIAKHLPGAHIVKAFNTLYGPFIEANPAHEEGRQVAFYAGDDAAAKQTAASFISSLGFAAIDLGDLREGGALMQLDGPLSGQHFLLQSIN